MKFLILLFALAIFAEKTTFHVSQTNHDLPLVVDNCNLYQTGYLHYSLFWVYINVGSVGVYKCDVNAWDKSMILSLKISHGLSEWIVGKAVDKVVNALPESDKKNEITVRSSQLDVKGAINHFVSKLPAEAHKNEIVDDVKLKTGAYLSQSSRIKDLFTAVGSSINTNSVINIHQFNDKTSISVDGVEKKSVVGLKMQSLKDIMSSIGEYYVPIEYK